MPISQRRSPSILVLCIIAVVLVAAPHLSSQSVSSQGPILVTFNFSVWDNKYRPIQNLEVNRVHISVGGHEQPIESLMPVPGRPISVIFLEDQSGSRVRQVGPRKSYVEMPAASRFLQSLAADGTNVLVASFAQGTKLFGSAQQAFSRDPSQIDLELRALSQETPRGPTALFDALSWASKQLTPEPGFRAVVVVSDGMDNASHASLEDTVAAVQASKVSVFFLNTILAEDEMNRHSINDSEHTLSEAARRIGGEALRLNDAHDADLDFAKIAADIKFSYNVSFRVDSQEPITKLHDLKVTVDGDHLRILSPAGTYTLPH